MFSVTITPWHKTLKKVRQELRSLFDKQWYKSSKNWYILYKSILLIKIGCILNAKKLMKYKIAHPEFYQSPHSWDVIDLDPNYDLFLFFRDAHCSPNLPLTPSNSKYMWIWTTGSHEYSVLWMSLLPLNLRDCWHI